MMATEIDSADVREHLVNEMRDKVLRLGHALEVAAMDVGRKVHSSATPEEHAEASRTEIAANRAFVECVIDTFAVLKQALHDADAPVVWDTEGI